MHKDIRSETTFLLHLIGHIIATPWRLVLMLFGKRKLEHVLEPFSHVIVFITEARTTFGLLLSVVLCYFGSFFLTEQGFLALAHTPGDLYNGRYHSWFTAGFLHADIFHLLGNMLGIFIFGRVVEKNFGSGPMLGIYVLGLFMSGLLSGAINYFLLGDVTPGIGASGALMGLVGVAMLRNPFYLTYYFILPVPIMIWGWLALYADFTGILNPGETGIGHLAHLGGFLGTSLIVYVLSTRHKLAMRQGLAVNIASFILALVIIQVFIR